jgi:hypothetical protein
MNRPPPIGPSCEQAEVGVHLNLPAYHWTVSSRRLRNPRHDGNSKESKRSKAHAIAACAKGFPGQALPPPPCLYGAFEGDLDVLKPPPKDVMRTLGNCSVKELMKSLDRALEVYSQARECPP